MPFQFILLIAFFIVATLSAADEITIVADEWPPYNGKPNSTEPGYGIEIAKHIFEAAGHTVVYSIVPWNRAIRDAKNGEYNAIIGATKQEAPDFIFPEEEFGLSENAFFVKKGGSWESWEYKGAKSLLSARVGLIKEYSYGKELDRFFKVHKNSVQYVHGDDPLLLNINKLLIGRFDVTIEDSNVFLQKAMKMGVADQIIKVRSKKTTEDNRIYIAFSPKKSKSREYAGILTKGINNLRRSGELEIILAKYGLKDWK